jgi:hypothetical protein
MVREEREQGRRPRRFKRSGARNFRDDRGEQNVQILVRYRTLVRDEAVDAAEMIATQTEDSDVQDGDAGRSDDKSVTKWI